jgi:hypothetical protein
MSDFDSFWGRIGRAAPGMLDLGLGIYARNQGQKEAADRLRAAQGPLYDQAMAGVSTALSRANMDPQAAAQERFNAQHELLAGVDAKSEADLMRILRSKGMLGISNFKPGVVGITPNGTPMNPHMAAYYAARNARDAKMSADSLDASERAQREASYLAGREQNIAESAQQSGLAAARTQPSRAASNMQLIKGLGGVLSNKDIWGKEGGLFGIGVDWLKDTFDDGQGFAVGFGDWWN